MIKKSVLYFISLIIWLVSSNNIALSEEKLPLSKVPQAQFSEFKLPGRLEGTGTRFELKDSDYLNITLDSTEPIKLVLESVPRIVTLHIEPASGLTSTQITLGGFLPLITYYKYEGSYHNLVTFTTDSAGKYTYIQDLSKPHFVFIQTHPSTVFLTDAGWSDPAIGSWDSATRTATLTADINQTIQIDANNITIDGNRHTITGSSTGLGVYLPVKTGITIKNLNVSGFTYGIFLYEGSNNNLSDNTALNNISGIYLHYSAGNLLLRNAASTNASEGIVLVGGSNNNLSDNTALNNRAGIRLTQSFNNNLSGIASVTEPVTANSEGKEQHIGGEAIDLAGNRAAAFVIVNIDKTPPQVTLAANPDTLWPPNHKMINVTVGGLANDNLSGIALTTFKVIDEYKLIEPVILNFNAGIQLEAWRNGDDLDGRLYTISVTTKDKADNQVSNSTTVICPHDQGKR